MKSTFSVIGALSAFIVLTGAAVASEGITLQACKTDIRAVVVRAVIEDADSPDEPGKLYVAQSYVEATCKKRAVESGLIDQVRMDAISNAVNEARDLICALSRSNGSMPTTGEQNQCELDTLSMMLRMYVQ